MKRSILYGEDIKGLLREFINSQHFTSASDILNSMKKLFSDVLQQIMEAEFEKKIGYEKSQRVSENDVKGVYRMKVKRYRYFAPCGA